MLTLYWNSFIRPYWPMVTAAVGCFIIASLAGLAAPVVIKYLIDGALVTRDLASLHFIIAGIVALYLVRGAFYYVYGYTIAKAGNQMVARLRQEMFAKLQHQDFAFFVNTSTGETISLFTNDLWLLQQAFSFGVPDMLVEALNLIAIMTLMIYFDWELALVTFATVPFIVVSIGYFNKKIASLGELVEEALSRVTASLQEYLTSITVVQSYTREDYEYQKFRINIQQAAGDLLKVQRLSAFLIPLVEFLAAIGLTVIIWYGGKEVINGDLTIGGMFAFLVYIINLPTPVRKISEAATKLKMGVVAWQRIERLDCYPHQVPEGWQELTQVTGKIEFRNVSFSYVPETGILNNITLAANPGEVVAIVGPSGAGKSSFANLLLRFYDPDKGAIYLDGVDIKSLKTANLRKQFGFIQQDPILFNMTILDNIRYGKPEASQEEVEQAARLTNAHDFIMELPQQYLSWVGELGNLLSGGQRQRIAIARAILSNPPLLLLDEPTAALDSHSEKLVLNAVRQVSTGRTTFMITHRLSTLAQSDKVVYLADGHIVECGTHEELVLQGGRYAQMVQQAQ